MSLGSPLNLFLLIQNIIDTGCVAGTEPDEHAPPLAAVLCRISGVPTVARVGGSVLHRVGAVATGGVAADRPYPIRHPKKQIKGEDPNLWILDCFKWVLNGLFY